MSHPAGKPPESAPDPEQWKSVVDRRSGLDRRQFEAPSETNLERRRGPGRRLTDSVKSAEEGEMNREQFLFLLAIDNFKRVNHKTFPSWTDVLEIIRKLGYRKTMISELNLGQNAPDWRKPMRRPVSTRKPRKTTVDRRYFDLK